RDLELEMIRKEGTTIPVLLDSTAIRDAAGNDVMSRTTVFDITGRRQAEALRQRDSDELKEQVRKQTAEPGAASVTLKVETEGRRRGEQALRDSLDRRAGIIESAMDAIVKVDDSQPI